MRTLPLACVTATCLWGGCRASSAGDAFESSARAGETTLIARDARWLDDGGQRRHSFFVDDPAAVGRLRGEVVRGGGGGIVTLNGVPLTFASGDWTAARAHLRAGANVITVASKDAAFAPALHATLVAPQPPGEDIPREAMWAYWDRGGDPGATWRMPGHDDSTWARGHEPIGEHPTIYFRGRFRVADAAAVSAMVAEVQYDEGVVLYLNGTEVRRLAVPSGGAYERVDLAAARALLVDGDNLLAVEVHQRSAPSSDLPFDLALDVTSSPPPPSPPSAPGIARGALWKVATGTGEPGDCWDWVRADDRFDDRSWLVMRAPVGYGGPPVRSVLPSGPDPARKYSAAYFRNTFTVDDPARITGLFADVLYDDGVVVYLNGAEVARRAMPAGFIQHGTAARGHDAGDTYETIDLGAFLRELKPGANVIAARVHQDRPSSDDLVFDLAVRTELRPDEVASVSFNDR